MCDRKGGGRWEEGRRRRRKRGKTKESMGIINVSGVGGNRNVHTYFYPASYELQRIFLVCMQGLIMNQKSEVMSPCIHTKIYILSSYEVG